MSVLSFEFSVLEGRERWVWWGVEHTPNEKIK